MHPDRGVINPPKNPNARTWSAWAPAVTSAHIPGLKSFGIGAPLSGAVDAMAVLQERMGTNGLVPTASELFPTGINGVEQYSNLRPYQRDGVSVVVGRLQRDGACLLADDMGLGKSLQTITSWQLLASPVPLLVLCPASVRRTWKREFAKWAGVDVTLVETGKQAEKVTRSTPVVVTSYELAGKLPDAFLPRMVVMDEAHLLRGRKASRSRSLIDIAKTADFRLALTGTPMWSRPRDFWMLLRILFGYRFGTADEFDFAYCDAKYNQWGGKENKGAIRLDELKKRLEYVMVRRTKEQVASDLPPMTRSIRWVPATKEAKKAMEASALGQVTFQTALAATLTGKIDAAVEAADEAGKFLLFTWRKADAHAIAAALEELGHKIEVLTGDDTLAARDAAIQRARLTGASVVATIDSTNAGVDGLQHIASTAIFHHLDYVPIKVAQAEARLHRIGQNNPVTVVYLAMQNSADEFVVETVIEKLGQWTGAMGKDSTGAINEALTGQIEENEAAALKAIYAAMTDEEVGE